MKKIISTFLLLSFMVLMPLMTNESLAATAVSTSAVSSSVIKPCTGSRYTRWYKRHRNAMNVAYGAAGGAVLGALFGGKPGALIGAGAGAGGGALYTYKLNPKTKQCQKVYYRRG